MKDRLAAGVDDDQRRRRFTASAISAITSPRDVNEGDWGRPRFLCAGDPVGPGHAGPWQQQGQSRAAEAGQARGPPRTPKRAALRHAVRGVPRRRTGRSDMPGTPALAGQHIVSTRSRQLYSCSARAGAATRRMTADAKQRKATPTCQWHRPTSYATLRAVADHRRRTPHRRIRRAWKQGSRAGATAQVAVVLPRRPTLAGGQQVAAHTAGPARGLSPRRPAWLQVGRAGRATRWRWAGAVQPGPHPEELDTLAY
jgi:hypothetical protein